MGNCIFCKKRRVSESGIPKCPKHRDLRRVEKYLDVNSDIKCSKFEDGGFLSVFRKIGKGIESAIKILESQP